MDFNQYQQASLQTAIYPNRGKNLAYTVLGLVEETGEVVEKLAELDREGLIKELGDQCWYIANTCSEMNSEMSSLQALMTTLKCPTEDRALVDLMMISATQIAGKTKKVIRDDGGEVKADKRTAIHQGLAHVLAAIDQLARNHQLTLAEILEKNLKKLLDRKARNVLQGSGDNR